MLTRRGFTMIGLSIGTSAYFQPARAEPAARYMIASNRFGIATDWGVTTTSFAAGYPIGINGSTGTTQYFKNNCRRYFFSTGAWAPKAGRFLWTNAQMDIHGIFPGLYNVNIDKVQIRDLEGNLIDTVKFSGSASRVLGPGEVVWSDPGADLAANTNYFLDLYWTAVDNGAWPAQPSYYLPGEKSYSHGSTDLGSIDKLTSLAPGNISSMLGGTFGPSMFAAKGWGGVAPCVLILGDSIADYTRTCADFANARGDRGFIQQALGDASGGVMTWMTCARYSSYSPALYQDAGGGTTTVGLIDWFAAALSPLGPKAPFTAVIDEHGRNNMGAALAVQKSMLAATRSKLAEHWTGVKYFRTTCPPQTSAANYSLWTDATNQTASGNSVAGGVIQKWNDWLMSGADGQIDGCFDTAAIIRSPDDYGKWALRPYSSTLLTAVSANSTAKVRLADAPPIGETLAFEPGSSSNGDAGGYCVYEVTAAAGGGYDVVLHRDQRASNASLPTSGEIKVAKPHAAGALVRAAMTLDGLHPNNIGQMLMRDVVVAGKAALAV